MPSVESSSVTIDAPSERRVLPRFRGVCFALIRGAILAGCWLGLVCPKAEADAVASANPSAEQIEFFENKVRPVLATHCYSCHSAEAKKLKAGLRLDSRAGVLKGGGSGPAIVPENPAKSLLIQAVNYGDPDTAMPSKQKLFSRGATCQSPPSDNPPRGAHRETSTRPRESAGSASGRRSRDCASH